LFWESLTNPSSIEPAVSKRFALVGIMLYIERAGTISSTLDNLFFALELLETRFTICEDFFDEYLMLIVDLRTLIVLEMLNDENVKASDLHEFFTNPLVGNETYQSSKKHQEFFSRLLDEQSEAVKKLIVIIDSISTKIERRLEAKGIVSGVERRL
jgi:hypothetical protein